MDLIFKTFLFLHIVGGSLGLLTGMMNMLRKKGDKNHKRTGIFIAMITAGVSSLALASLHPNYFLFMVGVFTLYMVLSGQRYLKHQQQNNIDAKGIEWTITILMLCASLLFIGMGIFSISKSNLFGLVFVTFGSLGILFVRQDFQNYQDKSPLKNYWLIGHLQRMIGGFIAALTAFLVVNAKLFPDQIPGYLIWLLPSALLTPLIIKWSRQYRINKN
ncbi:MAG: hypothetical protein IPP69_13985 [Flavobacteriales bacterium]|nr:hypothetical protein [Flavobacteriales bacterium]